MAHLPSNRSAGPLTLTALLAAAVGLTAGAQQPPEEPSPVATAPPLTVAVSDAPAEPVGPPWPLPATPLPLLSPLAALTGGAGPLGYFGPVPGSLNTALTGGPVRGPIWGGEPLPAVGAPVVVIEPESTLELADTGGAAASSELPDPRKLELARLANPALAAAAPAPSAVTPPPPAAEPTAPAVTAEHPLTVRLTFPRPPRGHDPGATVPVRVVCNVDAHVVVFGVDGAGRAATLGRSAAPVRSFGVALRAQAEPGPHYLVAVAAVHPLTGTDVAAALRGNGTGWLSPVATVANEAAGPVAAWGTVAQHAQGLGGSARGWKRHEWALSAASFAVRSAPRIAADPAAGEKAPQPPASGQAP